MTELKKYGKRIVWKNPFKKKTGWVYINMSRVLQKQIMGLNN